MDEGSDGWVEDRKQPERREDFKQGSAGAASPLFGGPQSREPTHQNTTADTRDYANEGYEGLLDDDEKYPEKGEG